MVLSFVALMAGSAISRTRLVFKQMSLSVVSARTFVRPQRYHMISKMLDLKPQHLIHTKVLQNGHVNAKRTQITFLYMAYCLLYNKKDV